MSRLLNVAATTALISAVAGSAVAAAPQRTTATYGDWTLRCVMQGQTKVCEMAQSMQIKGQTRPITQIAIGRQAKNDPMRIVFEVPINVWLPDGVKLTTDNKKLEISATFTRCMPIGCFADVEISKAQIKDLRDLKKAGKLQFKDAGKQQIAIPVSFKGFGDAYDAMQKP